MKGNIELVKVLNSLQVDELTALNQYIVHSEMCGIGVRVNFIWRFGNRQWMKCIMPSG